MKVLQMRKLNCPKFIEWYDSCLPGFTDTEVTERLTATEKIFNKYVAAWHNPYMHFTMHSLINKALPIYDYINPAVVCIEYALIIIIIIQQLFSANSWHGA